MTCYHCGHRKAIGRFTTLSLAPACVSDSRRAKARKQEPHPVAAPKDLEAVSVELRLVQPGCYPRWQSKSGQPGGSHGQLGQMHDRGWNRGSVEHGSRCLGAAVSRGSWRQGQRSHLRRWVAQLNCCEGRSRVSDWAFTPYADTIRSSRCKCMRAAAVPPHTPTARISGGDRTIGIRGRYVRATRPCVHIIVRCRLSR